MVTNKFLTYFLFLDLIITLLIIDCLIFCKDINKIPKLGSNSNLENENSSVTGTDTQEDLDQPSTSSGSSESSKLKRKNEDGDSQSKRLRKSASLTDYTVKNSKLSRWLTYVYLDLTPYLILFEYECKYYSLLNLLSSNYWKNENHLKEYGNIILQLAFFFDRGVASGRVDYGSYLIKDYILNSKFYKSKLLSCYLNKGVNLIQQMDYFIANMYHLKCRNIIKSFSILVLIFENYTSHLFNIFLLFLILCSIVDLNDFQLVFYQFISDEELFQKVTSLSSEKFSNDMKQLRSYINESPTQEKPKNISSKTSNYKLKLNLDALDFGSKFCAVLLELSLIKDIDLDINPLLLFFGTRLFNAMEILLALTILAILKCYYDDVELIVTSILYDSNIQSLITKKVLELHELDLSNMKSGFNTCFEHRIKYRELSDLITETDYQAVTRLKREGERCVKSTKYTFMI